ncbi:MAG: putative ribosome biogenesis GTPase RsgA [Lysobacterales bacterium]|jgi:ribosome biogenesis GTPase|nr:MAG: putative ribosome biogenesis GTPase RsgA [Xanthomonadales bacterium]
MRGRIPGTNGEITCTSGGLVRIGWCVERFGEHPPGALARVAVVERTRLRLHDGERVFPAVLPTLLRRARPEARPVVGDWVRYVEEGGQRLVKDCLARRNLLVRADSETGRPKPMVANVDEAFILSALDGDFHPRRIERYLNLVLAAGIAPLVLLTRADRAGAGAADAALARLAEIAPGCPAQVLDPRAPESAALLAPYLRPGTTVVLLGSSGVGKSTLLNTLLGEERRRTGAFRERDGKGRHTTTERALFPLPSGACVIDTPGLRALAFTPETELAAFADIEALAESCRFRDCRHEREPGCAVREAVAEGRLAAERLAHYRKLLAELEARRRPR